MYKTNLDFLMKRLIWKKTNSVHIVELDSQFQNVCEKLNELFRSIRFCSSEKDIQILLFKLLEQTLKLHSLEAFYFNKLKYPDTRSHSQNHLHLVSIIEKLQRDYSTSQPLINLGIIDALVKDFEGHFNNEDKMFAAFVKKNSFEHFMHALG
jgi:hemerythrin-like metal-binding protein